MTAPVVTAERMVAFLYGAAVHPSLRAGLEASADLVAGQPGPWELHDEEVAAVCERLAHQVVPPVPVAELGARVVAALDEARTGLFTLYTDHRATMPVPLQHHVETLEARLTAAIADFGDQLAALTADPAPPPTAAAPAPAPVDEPVPDPVAFPSIEASMKYSAADWQSLIRDRGLSVPDVKAEMQKRARTAGRVPPAQLSGLKGNRAFCELTLRVISDLYVASTEQVR